MASTQNLCLPCYKEQKEVYTVELVNVPPETMKCDGCGHRRRCWTYRVDKRKGVKKRV